MEKSTFIKRGVVIIAVVLAILMLVIGLCFGRVIEGSLFAEIAKWVAMYLVVLMILEGLFLSSLGLFIWHCIDKNKDKK